ncbi:MAG: hypothetical protein ACKO0M_05070 [Cyanobium sp.]
MSAPVCELSLGDLVLQAGAGSLAGQAEDGSFPAGWNGPYRDPETPVRNTAHWLFLLLRCWAWTGEERWRAAALRALAYLTSKDARPMGASFWCRRKPQKDFCNGLVGQAWALEGLLEAQRLLDDERALVLAGAVFHAHPFCTRRAAWHCLHVDGHRGRIDPTFNHQLWFAVQAGELADRGDAEAGSCLQAFLARLPGRLLLYPSGLIRHENPYWQVRQPLESGLAGLRLARSLPSERGLHAKSVGYHAFNTTALAQLLRWDRSGALRSSGRLQRAFAHLGSGTYRRRIAAAPYGYEYNPPGFEVPVSLVLADRNGLDTRNGLDRTPHPPAADLIVSWLETQVRHGRDPATGQFSRGSGDPATAAARLYEATRLDPALRLTSG